MTPDERVGFPIDEDLERQTATCLENEGIRGEHVSGVLFPGADDSDDVIPYARREDQIVLTDDVLDFEPLVDDEYEGIVVLYDQRLPAWAIANGLFYLVDQYRDRNEFRRKEVRDPYVE